MTSPTNRRLLVALFAVAAAAELGALAAAMASHHAVRSAGALYRLATHPVDPYDPFRGRYVALAFAFTTGALAEGSVLRADESAYASLHPGADGFAWLGEVSAEPPSRGDYLRVRVAKVDRSTVTVEMPFDRFYLNERLAPAAERSHLQARGRDSFVTVRVRDGRAVLEQLFVGGEVYGTAPAARASAR